MEFPAFFLSVAAATIVFTSVIVYAYAAFS
jgi:hypothetical protein